MRSLPVKKKQIEELNAILESELNDTASEGEGKFDLTGKEDFVSRATQVNVEIPYDHRFSVIHKQEKIIISIIYLDLMAKRNFKGF